MVGIGKLFKQAGQAAQTSPSSATGPAMPAPPSYQTFNIQLYFKAVQLFGKDFFGKLVPEFFKDPQSHLQNFSSWWAKQKQDEQAAYGGVLLGSLMVVIGIVLIIVL